MEQFKKQIDNEVKGCGLGFNTVGDIWCGDLEHNLCPNCKTRIKTYLTTMIKCYEEAKERFETLMNMYKNSDDDAYFFVDGEIKTLKQKINYLKEKLEEVK